MFSRLSAPIRSGGGFDFTIEAVAKVLHLSLDSVFAGDHSNVQLQGGDLTLSAEVRKSIWGEMGKDYFKDKYPRL